MPQAVIRSVSRRRPLVGAAPPPVIRPRPPVIPTRSRTLATRGTALILKRGSSIATPHSLPLAVLLAIATGRRFRPRPQYLAIPAQAGTPVTTPVDLFEAVVAFLMADAGLAALAPGGIAGDEASLGTVMPYLVISEPEGDYGNESNGASVEPVRLQVSVFAIGKAQARVVRRYLKTLLQDAPLTFTAGTLLHLRAADRTGMKDPDRGPAGRDIWQEIQFFQAVVGHG